MARVLRKLPDDLKKNALASAARAGAQVVRREAILRLAGSGGIAFTSDVVIKKRRTRNVVAIYDIGPNRRKPQLRWLEFGTDAHEIAADVQVRTSTSGRQLPGQRVRKFRRKAGIADKQVLVTTPGGDFLGKRIQHPGQPARPWFRPAYDHSRRRALEAMARQLGKATRRQARRLVSREYRGRQLRRILR